MRTINDLKMSMRTGYMNLGLSPRAEVLLTRICKLSQKTGSCKVRAEILCDYINCKRSSFYNYLKELRSKDLIMIKRNGYSGASTYLPCDAFFVKKRELSKSYSQSNGHKIKDYTYVQNTGHKLCSKSNLTSNTVETTPYIYNNINNKNIEPVLCENNKNQNSVLSDDMPKIKSQSVHNLRQGSGVMHNNCANPTKKDYRNLDELNAEFQKIYTAYPAVDSIGKGSKTSALYEFNQVVKEEGAGVIALILEALTIMRDRRKAADRTGEFLPNFPYLSKFLREKRWESVLESAPKKKVAQPTKIDVTDDEIRKPMRKETFKKLQSNSYLFRNESYEEYLKSFEVAPLALNEQRNRVNPSNPIGYTLGFNIGQIEGVLQ